MSQPDPAQPAADVAAEQAAAQAVIDHHARLAAALNERVETLIGLVETDHLLKAATARQELLDYLRREILPHARAEEQTLYLPAAARTEGRLLVEGMLAEHQALATLIGEVAEAGSLPRSAAAARALAALFAAHLAKENTLVLPLLIAAPEVSLVRVLAGMHELLGGQGTGEGGAEAQSAGGCGCGGCGCGGDQAGDAAGDKAPAAPVLSLDTRLDVREVPHDQRHALVLSTVAALPPGHAVVLVAPHAPRPVLAEIDGRFGGQVQAQWLQSGPEVWQIRLERCA